MAYYCKYYNSAAAITLSKKKTGTLLGKKTRTYDTWYPEADIFETDAEIVIIIDLPGVEAEDIDLILDGNYLIIRGNRNLERPKLVKCYCQLEINHGQFERILELPCQVTLGKARITSGVLEITLPKVTSAEREIKID